MFRDLISLRRGRVAIASLGLVILGIVALPIAAHHSTAPFDNTRTVRIEGTVTQFRWTNPHASIKLEGKAEGGPDGLWTIEMTAPNVLVNQGWKRTSIKAGDSVVMFANPLRDPITLNDGSQGGLYVGIILADGSTLGRTDGAGQGSAD